MMAGEPIPSEQDAAVLRARPDLFGDEAAWRRAPVVWGFEVGPGWRPIVLRFLDRLREAPAADSTPVRIRQVKEKLGELRVYVRGGGEAARAAIRAAEEEASRTCEICGTSGRLRRDRSHIQVLCNRHAHTRPSAALVAAARRCERTDVRRAREVVAVVDGWTLEVEDGYVVLGGEERGSGQEVDEVVLAVDLRPVPRAYAVGGWLELGRAGAPVDWRQHLLYMQSAADDVRDRLLRGAR